MWELMHNHRSFFIKETIVASVINMLISYGITFLTFRSQTEITLWGKAGLFFDLIPTICVMIFCMALIMTLATHKRIEKGKAPNAPWQRKEHVLLRLLPEAALFRAVLISLFGLIVLLPTATGLLTILIQFPASINEVIALKTCFGALIGVLFTPFILSGAMADKGGIHSLESKA